MGYNYDDFDQVMDLITKEKYDDAERLLKSMQDHPDQARVNYYLAQVYMKKGWLESAVEYAGKAYSAEPDNQEYAGFYNDLNSQRNTAAPDNDKSDMFCACCCTAIEGTDCCCDCMDLCDGL